MRINLTKVILTERPFGILKTNLKLEALFEGLNRKEDKKKQCRKFTN